MRITFNGQDLDVPAECPLDQAIDLAWSRFHTASEPSGASSAPAQACATALNGRFIAKGLRADTRLADGDQVTTFQAIVGG